MKLLDGSKFDVDWQQVRDVVAGSTTIPAETYWHPDIAAALPLIVENLSRCDSIDELVALMPIGRRTLERRLQTQLRLSIRQVVTRVRLEVARQILVRTHLTITEIAVESGFSSPSRMSHVFRRQLGCSPRHYRQKHHAR